MRKLTLFLLVFTAMLYSNAQTAYTDSIKQLLQNEKADTSRVLHLAVLSYEYHESKPDTSMMLALEAYSLANRIGFLKGIASSLNRLGGTFEVLGNYPKAMDCFLQALKINEKINNPDGKQSNLNNIGLIYADQEDYRQALPYYFNSKALTEQLSNKRSMSIVCGNLAEAYYFLNQFDSARQYAQQSYDTASKIGYSRIIGSSLNRLGTIHLALGHNAVAAEYYR